MLTFCTLFDSNYLDKGLALHKSLENVASEYKLYVLAMDDNCKEILDDMKLSHVTVISSEEFEDKELKEIKEKRTRAEFCWTCTASLIEYVFEIYKEEFCTYIDSDLYFYNNPKVLIEEMCHAGCSVQIVEHGFGRGWVAKQKEIRAGKYCVEFNTFRNDSKGREVLHTWNRQCRKHCSMAPGEMGDQKYLSEWTKKYNCVHVLEHQGAGVAPWNIFRFKYINGMQILEKKTKKKIDLIFYHFHHLEFVDEKCVNINVYKKEIGSDPKLVRDIYFLYLKEIMEIKEFLKKEYGITPMLKKHPGVAVSDKKFKYKNLSITDFIWKLRNKPIYKFGSKKDIVYLSEIQRG